MKWTAKIYEFENLKFKKNSTKFQSWKDYLKFQKFKL